MVSIADIAFFCLKFVSEENKLQFVQLFPKITIDYH